MSDDLGSEFIKTPMGDINIEEMLKKYELTPEEIRFAKEFHKGDGPNPYLEGGVVPDTVPLDMRTPLALAKWRKNNIRWWMKKTRQRKAEQQRFLDAMRDGMFVKDALQLIDRVRQTLDNWRAADPEFERQFQEAKQEGSRTRSDVRHVAKSSNINDLTFEQKRKYLFDRDTYWFQSELNRIIDDAPEGEITMILLPPGSGKTLTLEDRIKIEIGENPDIRILYISETDDLPKKVIAGIKEGMTDPEIYPNYIMAYGPFKQEDLESKKEHKKWAEQAIKVSGSTGKHRDYTIVAKGWRTHITNIRADIIICDDMQTISTLHLTDKLLGYIRNSFLNRRERLTQGKFIVIGHRLGMNDIYQAMIDAEMVLPENLFILPLTHDETPDRSNFEPLFPSDILPLVRRQQGEMFETIMLQKPERSKMQTFRDALSEFWDEEWSAQDARPRDMEKFETVTSVDPALSGGCCILTTSYDLTNMRLRDMHYQFNMHKPRLIEDKIEQQVLRYGSQVVIIESKAFQAALVTSERMENMAKRYGFTIIPHDTGSNKHDEIMGVPQMEFLMATGGIKAPGADARSKETFLDLYSQLEKWRPDVPTKSLTQDCVMALWFAWFYVTRRRRTGAPLMTGLHDPHNYDNSVDYGGGGGSYGIPWRPTSYVPVSTSW
jgi:hypothetical protein